MKVKEYSDMQKYLVRKDTRTPEQKKAADDAKKKAELTRINNKRKEYALKPVTEFSDTPMGKHIENTLYMYGDLDEKPKHYDELMLQAIRKSSTPVKGYVGGATPFTKVKKVKPAQVKNNKPKQLEFNFLDNITDAYEPMFNYEPLPSPAPKPRDKDLDAGIATILGVKVRDA